MSIHKEIRFEDEICDYLSAHGWDYSSNDEGYDRSLALFPPDLIAWVQESQPEAWKVLQKTHGANVAAVLSARVRKQIDKRGTLDVMRHGIEMVGLRKTLRLSQFKPAMSMNPDIVDRYKANRLRVIRQLHYSTQNQNSIDLVLFLNGLPMATVELKTNFTQSIGDAIDQYRFDRLPKPKGQAAEPLLSFPSGALVHFAVSNSEVHMTTKLAGPATFFLPFNKGDDGGAGNPVNPDGHRTSYLWEQVWERESWLELLGRYIIAEKDKKKQITKVIFPRYHQLDATRKLVSTVLAEGAGQKYLIQHSAGSGKTNSIAWSAHFLADLHDADDKKMFDTVIVVSDRKVIDGQLQEAIFGFERTTGVVATITNEGGSKSKALAEALSAGKKIIICTIQTFPFALETVRELAATEHKTFAVIADEAHSSQTGQAAAKLKEILSPEEIEELEDGGEISTEDMLAAQMSSRAKEAGITYVAFTATPKAKTLELFGRPENPDLPVGDGNLPGPFHLYSMRQAIEEKFILDVLKNYTPYKLAFRLANDGKDWTDEEVESDAAMKGIMRWVRLHPYNISQKVQVVVEHFRENVARLLNGQAKAMVVVGSRQEAVRWQLAINKYIKTQGYSMGTLVAFSGEVNDKQSGPDPFSETGKELNPGLSGRGIAEAFDGPEYQILLVANKFQTGFDQPLLCAMYVDRRLAGVQAVQTLSRLNRAYPGKEFTYVIDFVNSSEEILKAFKQYHTTAELEAVTDPELALDLRNKLDDAGHYDDFEVDRVVEVEMNPKSTQGQLIAALEPVADRILKAYKAAQTARRVAEEKNDNKARDEAQDTLGALFLFKGDMAAFIRLYAFLSQVIDYGNTDIEKRFIFFRRLLPLLEFGREREGVDLSKVVLTHHNLKSLGKQTMLPGEGEIPKLPPSGETGTGGLSDKEKLLLSEIIAQVNELFEGEISDDDQLVYVNNVLKGKLLQSDVLVQQAGSNTKEQFSNSPDLKDEIMNAIIDAFASHSAMSKQAIDSERVRDGLKDVLLGPAGLYEALKNRTSRGAEEIK